MVKRLFIFASYDKDNIIDATLLHYLRALSELGDVIFTMDNDTPKSEMDKLSDIPNILHATAVRHNEYDFGSYKRGYMWAHDEKILDKYDWVYLVNDSMYGPLFNFEPVLQDLESRKVDLIGMTDFSDENIPKHIQSWFVGLSKKIAVSSFIYDFMKDIRHRDSKREIICKYEIGLSRIILQNGFRMSAVLSQDGENRHVVYKKPNVLLEKFIPFIKKSALDKVGDKNNILPYTSDEFIKMICAHAGKTDLELKELKIKTPAYVKVYRFTILSLPLFSVYKRIQYDCKLVNYKIFLFDILPIIKISTCGNFGVKERE